MRWLDDLTATLTPLTENYRTLRAIVEGEVKNDTLFEIDPIDAHSALRNCAGQTLSEIALALSRLPALRDVMRDGPVPDLMAGLNDLGLGLRPNLFHSSPRSTGRLNTRTQMLKFRAVACVHVLKRSGLKEAPSRRKVAEIFARAGHKGKKGAPLGASTIYEWCLDLEPNFAGNFHQKEIAKLLASLPSPLPRMRAIDLVKMQALIRL